MAKTESTAVNALIDQMKSGRPIAPSEPGADLFAQPRMSTTQPVTKVSGEVAPLPRARAPQATSEQPMPSIPVPMVRMREATPSRGNTIPPLAMGSTRGPSGTLPPPQRASSQNPASRGSRPSAPLPPPRASSNPRASSTLQMPPMRAASGPIAVPARVPSGTLPPPSGTLPSMAPPPGAHPALPHNAPIAAPFEVRITQPSDSAIPFAARVTQPSQSAIPTAAETFGHEGNWFDVSANVHKINPEETWVGTLPPKRAETLALAKKLVVPTIVLAIAGILVGGYFAFDGQGGKKKQNSAKPAQQIAEPAKPRSDGETVLRAPARSPESANAATASAGGEQPQPPTQAEQAAEIAAAAAGGTEVAAAKPGDSMTREAPAAVVDSLAKVREVKTPQGVVTFVDVRIDSEPQGATVTLIDNGKQIFLGSTPLSTSVDASREYDVIVAKDGRPTQMVHLDASKTTRLDVSLGRRVAKAEAAKAEVATAEVAAAPAKSAAEERRERRRAERAAKEEAQRIAREEAATAKAEAAAAVKAEKIAKAEAAQAEKEAAKAAAEAAKAEKIAKAEAAKAAKEAARAEKAGAAKTEKAETTSKASKSDKAGKAKDSGALAEPFADDAAGTGTLMVSSKPPCEIQIDGKATGLTTPQRAIELPVGRHKVTFINEAEGIKKTVSISITSGQATKLIQDFLAK